MITCSDSGGPAELVTNDENGFVTAPDARALATALASVTEHSSLVERLGAAGYLGGQLDDPAVAHADVAADGVGGRRHGAALDDQIEFRHGAPRYHACLRGLLRY